MKNEFKNNIKTTPELTAMKTSKESESARYLLDVIKISKDKSADILDYGCGLGRNMIYLNKKRKEENLKIDIYGTDTDKQILNIKNSDNYKTMLKDNMTIYTKSELENNDKKYDYILNCHVLNVVGDSTKKQIINDIYKYLKRGGKAIIQIRTESDIATSKTKERYGDGWIIKKGKELTYQEGVTKEKMQNMLTGVGFKIINHKFNKSIHIIEVEK